VTELNFQHVNESLISRRSTKKSSVWQLKRTPNSNLFLPRCKLLFSCFLPGGAARHICRSASFSRTFLAYRACTQRRASALGKMTTTSWTSAADTGVDVGSAPKKLHGREFYRSIGEPKFVVAPMVDQSEFVSSVCSSPLSNIQSTVERKHSLASA